MFGETIEKTWNVAKEKLCKALVEQYPEKKAMFPANFEPRVIRRLLRPASAAADKTFEGFVMHNLICMDGEKSLTDCMFDGKIEDNSGDCYIGQRLDRDVKSLKACNEKKGQWYAIQQCSPLEAVELQCGPRNHIYISHAGFPLHFSCVKTFFVFKRHFPYGISTCDLPTVNSL